MSKTQSHSFETNGNTKGQVNGPLLDHQDEEDVLLNNNHELSTKKDSMAISPAFKKAKTAMNDSKWSVFCIYFLLISFCALMVYFNYQIYQNYINHIHFISNSLDTTKQTISERSDKLQSNITSFLEIYSQRVQKFQGKLQALETKMKDIKKDAQYKFDKIELLSIKNTQEIAQIQMIKNQQKKYVEELKYYQQETTIKNTQRVLFPTNQYKNFPQFQSIAWVFVENYDKDEQYMRQLYLNNIKNYAYQSNFQIKFITIYNYVYFVSREMLTKLSSIFSTLERRLTNHDRSNLGDHIETIKKVLIMVGILYEHGGAIFIDNIALTEPLNWLNSPQVLEGFNHVDPQMPPQVISFFNCYYSARKIMLTGQYKQIYEFPNIQRYFLAAVKKSEFVGKLLDEITGILLNPFEINNRISQQKYEMGILEGHDPYYEFFYIAGHLVIQNKQRQLDKLPKSTKNIYAIDYYGLYTVNCLIGPMKLKEYFNLQSESYMYNNLMDITRQQFQDKIGYIRFLHLFENYTEMNRKMLDIKNNRRRILNQSFIHSLFFSSNQLNNQQFIYNRTETQAAGSSSKTWINLPKKLWIYSGYTKTRKISRMIIKNNIKLCQQSGFQVSVVNSRVLSSRLDKEIVKDITDKFTKSHYPQATAMKQYTMMLAFLSRYGGVILDSSYLLLEGLNWLVNINNVNPNLMLNRMGDAPKMFMFHNYHPRPTFNYTFDTTLHSRTDDRLIYQKSFVAAENDSLLLQQWIEEILKSIYLTQEQLDKKFNQCGIQLEAQFMKNIDDLPIDILRCLYIKGLKQASKQGMYNKDINPYNLWSLDGDYSVYKIRKNTNYENIDKDEYKFITTFPMSETEQRIGPIFKLLKFDDANIEYMNGIYSHQRDHPFKWVHKQSIFAKYFLNQK